MQHQAGDDIGVFLAVCAAGSFAAAGGRLHLSPSAVAKAVARLEARLSVTLFRRTTRRLTLTAEGALYRDSCQQARSEIERVEAVIGALTREPAGLLTVSLPPLFGAQVVAPALYALCARWPGLSLSLGTSVEHVDLAAAGFDLAVRIGALPDSAGLMARRLGVQALTLCGSAGYFADRAPPRDIAELARHALIGSPGPRGTAPWPLIDESGAQLPWVPPSRLQLEGSLLTLAAVREGRGIGLLPHWLVRDDIARGSLVPVLTSAVGGGLPVHVVWPEGPAMLPRLRVAIDAILAAAQPVLQNETAPR